VRARGAQCALQKLEDLQVLIEIDKAGDLSCKCYLQVALLTRAYSHRSKQN
jgi:hypothetical protein